MKTPAGLDDLHVLGVADLPRYRRAMEEGARLGFGYGFAGLLASQRIDRRLVLLDEDQGALCVYRWGRRDRKNRLELLFPPLPHDPAVLTRCLQRIDDYNRDHRGRVLKLDAGDVAALEGAGLRVRPRKQQYLYAPAVYRDLAGGRFRTLRRQLRRVAELDGLRARPYAPADEPACLDLLAGWRRHHRANHGTRGGVGGCRRILRLAASLAAPELLGEVIEFGGRVVGFAFGGRLRAGHGVFIEARCDAGLPGLSYYQRHHFLLTLGGQGIETVNDGPDVGRAGLAQLKNSLRPVAMHTEYRAGRGP